MAILPESIFKRYFPSYVKPFVSLFLSCIFYFVTQIRKTLQKEIKDWVFWSPFINWGTPSGLNSCWLNQWKWLVQDPITGSRIFCQTQGIWIVFSWPNVLPKLIKITVTCSISKYKWDGSILACPKSETWLSIVNFSKTAIWPIWKCVYIQSWRS